MVIPYFLYRKEEDEMISSVFSLKETTNIPDNLFANKETNLEENYYLNDSLNFLLECQRELLSYRRDFYKLVLESAEENPYVINEAFNDVMDKIKAIIKKILAYIESLVKRFITAIAKFVSSDKYIIKHKKDFSKFPSKETFTISGYNYTLQDNVPAVDVVGLDMNNLRSKLLEIGKSNDAIGVKASKLSVILSEMSSEERLEQVRKEILRVSHNISDSDFVNEVFAIYRDGKSSEDSITIRKEDVTRAANDFEDYKKKIKEVNRLKSEISAKYKSLEGQLDDIIKYNINDALYKHNGELENSISNNLSTLVNQQVQVVNKISTYHVQAIAAKLDAYNALVVQDKNILYKALNIIQKDISNMRIMESYEVHDYTLDAMNKQYVLERYLMNKEQQRFVEQCLAISESNIPQLKTINEDLKMDKKGMFDRIKEFFKQLFEKFLMKMNKFFTSDKSFLEKYKDVILTKKVEPYSLNNMPDYKAGISTILDHQFKKLDLKNILEKDELGIQKELMPKFEGDNFAEYCKRYFLCANKPNQEKVESSTLKMAEIYSFCTTAPNTVKTLEADKTAFENEVNKVKNEVLNKINSKNEAMDIYGEKFYYSMIHEAFINEDKKPATDTSQITKDGTGTNDASGNPKGDAKTINTQLKRPDDNAGNKDEYKDSADKAKQKETDFDAEKQAKENANADAKKVEETAKWYLKALQTVCTAKITSYQKIYSEYMKILRYHVRAATGSMGSTSKFDENDIKNLKDAMKEHKNGDKDAQANASKKIISIYKSKNMVIDDHDVQNLVNQNAGNLD